MIVNYENLLKIHLNIIVKLMVLTKKLHWQINY